MGRSTGAGIAKAADHKYTPRWAVNGRPSRSAAQELETSMSPRRLAILASALVTAQPRFNAHGRLIGAGISICRERVSLKHNARVEMDHALGAKAESLPPDGHVPGKSAVEVFGHRFR